VAKHKNSRSLIGTNVHVPRANSPDDHLVTNLPLLKNKNVKHWAGLLPVNDKGDGYLFYWLFAPDPEQLTQARASGRVHEDESNVPLVLWLNGGPACSSMDGLWLENGPFRLNPGDNNGNDNNWDDITLDPHSWHNAPAYVLYVDQPVGTGLAFTTSGNYPNNDERVNQDFYYFLTEFMKLHGPNLNVNTNDAANHNLMKNKNNEFDNSNSNSNSHELLTLQRPFYFSGESHAGHYIPSMMNYIRKQNSNQDLLKQNNGVLMPVSGALIGNGWFDPVYQYSAHEVAYGYGLIGKAQERVLAEREQTCRNDLIKFKQYTSSTCFQLVSDVVDNSLGRDNEMVVSQYDQRVWEMRKTPRDFPPGHREVESYLGQASTIANAPIQEVLEAIHATPSWHSGQRYRECTDPPYNALKHQDGLGVVDDIVELLNDNNSNNDDNTRLLFFNGVHDLICNHVGNENALENLPWNHQTDYVEAKRYGWQAPSTRKLAGYMKEYQNLGFLKVLNSGHMVPLDVPSVALDMLRTFVYNESFLTYKQTIEPKQKADGDVDCPILVDCAKHDQQQIQGKSSKACDGECTEEICLERFHLASSRSNKIPSVVWGILAIFALAILSYLFFKLCGSSTNGYGKTRNRRVIDNGLVRRGSMRSLSFGRMKRRPSGKYCGNGGIVEMADTSTKNLYSDKESNDKDNAVSLKFFDGQGDPYIDEDEDEGGMDSRHLENVTL